MQSVKLDALFSVPDKCTTRPPSLRSVVLVAIRESVTQTVLLKPEINRSPQGKPLDGYARLDPQFDRQK